VAKQEDARTLGKALSGPLGALWRYRIGDYRVICEVQHSAVTILVIRNWSSRRSLSITDARRSRLPVEIPYRRLVSNTGIIRIMVATARKITVEIPDTLLQKAQQASGTGITQTVRAGLELLAASRAYKRLRQLRGKVQFSRTLAELKADR